MFGCAFSVQRNLTTDHPRLRPDTTRTASFVLQSTETVPPVRQ